MCGMPVVFTAVIVVTLPLARGQDGLLSLVRPLPPLHDDGACPATPWADAGGTGTCGSWCTREEVQPMSDEERAIFRRYFDHCRDLGIKPSAAVLNRLELKTGRLAMHGQEACGELELRALVHLLLDSDGAMLGGLRALDLSVCQLGVSSVLLVAQMLRHHRCCLDSLDLSYQDVSPEGACALAAALPKSRSAGPRVLRLMQVGLGDEGGRVMVHLLKNTSSGRRLRVLDLQNNFISFEVSRDIAQAAKEQGVEIYLQGNRVLDEVLNAVTHGVGELLVIGCSIWSAVVVFRKPRHYRLSTFAYCASLNVLYLTSTLYHSFFALGHTTVHIFRSLDYSAIFLLIAGSYSPLLAILFHQQRWARMLLASMWAVAICGIATVAMYRGPFQTPIRLSFFLGMGWTSVACLKKIAEGIGLRGVGLLALGGLLYTLGVPFFVRNQHTFGIPDHTIWHVWVMAATACHFCCIMLYVLMRPATTATELSGKEGEVPGDAENGPSTSSPAGGKEYRPLPASQQAW